MFQLPSVQSGTLACTQGTLTGRSFDLSAGTFVIGRRSDADMALGDEPGVSKTHAKILAEGEHYVIVDCESRNGTIVNGTPVQRHRLVDGDEIRICACVLRFRQRSPTMPVRVKGREQEAPIPVRPIADEETDPRTQSQATAPVATKKSSLWLWYVSGLLLSLTVAGAATAVLLVAAPTRRLTPAEAAPVAPAATAVAAPKAPVATDAAPATPTAVEPAAEVKVAELVDAGPPTVDDVAQAERGLPAVNNAIESELSPKPSVKHVASAARATLPAERVGKRTEVVLGRPGNIKSVDVANDDVVRAGQVLITFATEAGASDDEMISLGDRIASLEGVDSDEARAALTQARARLAVLQKSGGGPIVANFAGVVSELAVAAGDVTKKGQPLLRITSDAQNQVKVTLPKGVSAELGQSVTLVLKDGGEASGGVVQITGKMVVVDCQNTSASEVASIRL